ncbi:hypothetical protein [Streptomyces leeuwenhoekii]|uniref:Sle1_048 protein n=1 Tax=Streptomyces leeuwenhoekii TaxID=1437453 RepID=A0A0F7VL03_STRLW|nr:hypothetical protein [Streptomyces leeuwenhoekii]CQR59215.1 sle1_048 [Streptomyces leeuwenhoekii]
MAITTLAPADYSPAPIADPVTYKEAALLFMETGYPEFQSNLKTVVRKLTRWGTQDGLRTERRGGVDHVSFSDLLEAHARRHPSPGRP